MLSEGALRHAHLVAGSVLSNHGVAHPTAPIAPEGTGVTALTLAASIGTLAGSVLVAALALYRRRLPRPRLLAQANARLSPLLDNLQSGIVNDYITWLVLGLACLGGGLAVGLCS